MNQFLITIHLALVLIFFLGWTATVYHLRRYGLKEQSRLINGLIALFSGVGLGLVLGSTLLLVRLASF